MNRLFVVLNLWFNIPLAPFANPQSQRIKGECWIKAILLFFFPQHLDSLFCPVNYKGK